MKAETVARIDAALRRLDQGGHGDCVECGEKISIERLTALPFALRCRDCEEFARKGDERRLRAHQHGVARFACRLARLSEDPSAEFVVDVSKASDLLESTTGAMR